MAATPAEVVWSLFAAIGLVLHVLGAREAWADLRAIQVKDVARRRLLRLIVVLCLRNELARAGVKLVFLSVGIYALATPPPIRPEVSTFQTVAAWLLIGGVGVLDVEALLNRRDRRRLLSAVRQRRKVG